jgi:YgiT-type zinc finger domain-containing protein
VRCLICRAGDVRPGKTTFTIEREGLTLVLKGVPTRVCGQCGEGYFDEQTNWRIETIADRARHSGVEVAVQEYGTG